MGTADSIVAFVSLLLAAQSGLSRQHRALCSHRICFCTDSARAVFHTLRIVWAVICAVCLCFPSARGVPAYSEPGCLVLCSVFRSTSAAVCIRRFFALRLSPKDAHPHRCGSSGSSDLARTLRTFYRCHQCSRLHQLPFARPVVVSVVRRSDVPTFPLRKELLT